MSTFTIPYWAPIGALGVFVLIGLFLHILNSRKPQRGTLTSEGIPEDTAPDARNVRRRG